MPLIARQRSRLAVLAVLALVGSLLAGSAVWVAAKDGEADAKAMYSACVGAAAEDAGFNDMDGSFAEDAANCLAHYEITKGTSEGTFSPSASISRLQMALFLARAAGPAGITLPVASDQGFTDIDGYTDEIQDAINQVAELGIMEGRSDEMFSPSGLVNRQDMAVHLAAFLDDAVVGPGGQDIGKVKPDDDVFTDIGGVSFSTYGAIRNLYEMGVTTGRTDTTFAPDALVSRGQMAVFITRALAHTNARPAGLSVQADKTEAFVGETVEFVASIRDSSHRPIANESVDFFYVEGDDEPFRANGTCTSDVNRIGGTSECEIDAGDLTTNTSGNLDGRAMRAVGDDTQVWAWTGDLGDDFDADTTDSVTISISTSAAAANTRMTSSAATDTVKFGDTVTFTFQLVDKDGEAVAMKGATVTVRSDLRVDADAGGNGSDSSKSRTDTYTTDASGEIELSFTEDDPDSDKDSDDLATLTLTVTIPSNGGIGSLVDGNGKDAASRTTVMWDDDAAAATTLKLSSATMYHMASSEGKGVSNTVQATLTDQYGDPVNRAKVNFTSSGTAGAPDEARYTGSDGVASLSYLRDSANNGKETISASHGTINAKPLMHYWVQSSSAGLGSVLVADTANDKIVVEETDGDIVYVEYDSNDHLTSNGARKVLAKFEKDLGADLSANDLSLIWDIALDDNGDRDAAGVSSLRLTSSAKVAPTVDSTAPAVTGAATSYDGGSIVLSYDEALDAGSVPAAGAFAVRVTVNMNTPEETIRHTSVSGVSVSGAMVTLAVDPDIQVGDAVTVSYSRPSANALQDAAGNRAVSVSSMTVSNMVDVIAPMLVTSGMDIPKTSYSGTSVEDGSVMGASITLTYDEALDAGSVPAAGDFTVTDGTTDGGTVSAVSVSGMTVTLTISSGLSESTPITVGYTPGANALQDAAGNQAAAIDPAVSVMNRIDTMAPVLDTDLATEGTDDAPRLNIRGTVVEVTYSDARSGLDASSVPNPESYEVTIPAAPLVDADDDPATPMTRGTEPTGTRKVHPMSVSIDGNVVSLTLAADHRLLNGETGVLLDYTKARFGDNASGVVQDMAGNDAAELAGQAVFTNRIDSAAPTLTTTALSVDGLSIVLTYADTADGSTADSGSGLNPDFVPAASSYMIEITRNGVATRVSPSMVVISDASDPADAVYETVTLSLPAPVRVITGDTLTLTYDASAAGTRLQDLAGNTAADAGDPTAVDVTVTGLVDVIPVLTVTDDGGTPPVATEPKMSADGLSVVLTFRTLLDEDSVPSASAFRVTINGLPAPLASVSVDNVDTSDRADGTPDVGRVTLMLPSYLQVAAQNSPAVTVSYTDPTPGQDDRSGALQHATGKRDVASFGPHDVDTRPING
ncbi:MAG: SwmB domain-containing protein [bacterium]|nr:SwmB domain-containing protein [bacterium]